MTTLLETFHERTRSLSSVYYDSDEKCETCGQDLGDHLTAPVWDQSGLYGWSLLDESNKEYQFDYLEAREGVCDYVEGLTLISRYMLDEDGDLVDSEAFTICEEMAEALVNYPVLDEQDWSSREYESAETSWEQWGKADFLKDFENHVLGEMEEHPDFDIEEVTLDLEELLELHGIKESQIIDKFWEYSEAWIEEECFTYDTETTLPSILSDFPLLSCPPSKVEETRVYRANLEATSPLPFN